MHTEVGKSVSHALVMCPAMAWMAWYLLWPNYYGWLMLVTWRIASSQWKHITIITRAIPMALICPTKYVGLPENLVSFYVLELACGGVAPVLTHPTILGWIPTSGVFLLTSYHSMRGGSFFVCRFCGVLLLCENCDKTFLRVVGGKGVGENGWIYSCWVD